LGGFAEAPAATFVAHFMCGDIPQI